MGDQTVELVGFLRDARADVRALAAEHLLGLTGSGEGMRSLYAASGSGVLSELLRVANEDGKVGVSAVSALVNLSCDKRFLTQLVGLPLFWTAMLECALEGSPETLDQALMCLSNVTSVPDGAKQMMRGRHGKENAALRGQDVLRLLHKFTREPGRKQLQHAASVLTNVTQLPEGRSLILDPERGVISKLLVQLGSGNAVRRRGVAGTIRNCCFSVPDHERLIVELDIVGHLLLPLLGPESPDEITDDERDGMSPLLIASLATGDSLTREPEAAVRRLIVQSLQLLTTTRRGREELRARQAYPVVRTYHLYEEDDDASQEVFKLVDVLLAEEEAHATEQQESTDPEVVPDISATGTEAMGPVIAFKGLPPTASQPQDTEVAKDEAGNLAPPTVQRREEAHKAGLDIASNSGPLYEVD